MPTLSEKPSLRIAMLAVLRAMSAEERANCSERICRRILESQQWRDAERVLLFSPMRAEPDISALGDCKEELKLVGTIPRTLRHEHELELPFVPDLVLVPGLAFSRDGHRLGRGGGFYDRLLAGRARDAVKVGVCFALQLHDSIPREAHDVVLDAVISDD
jgi:5-formyltetrahydrofolate cyclo-ligase